MHNNVLESSKIRLRAIEPEDEKLLYLWENNTDIWNVSSNNAPYSRKAIQDYILSSSRDIYETRQIRFMIVDKHSSKTIGAIDLFEFDPHNRRAGVGILVSEDFRNKHIATEALHLLLNYCKHMLLLHQVYAEVHSNNEASIKLFTHAQFTLIGIKKDWMLSDNGYSDVAVYQHLL